MQCYSQAIRCELAAVGCECIIPVHIGLDILTLGRSLKDVHGATLLCCSQALKQELDLYHTPRLQNVKGSPSCSKGQPQFSNQNDSI